MTDSIEPAPIIGITDYPAIRVTHRVRAVNAGNVVLVRRSRSGLGRPWTWYYRGDWT